MIAFEAFLTKNNKSDKKMRTILHFLAISLLKNDKKFKS